MTHTIPQTLDLETRGMALWTHVHGAGNQPNIMDHLTHNHLREVLFAN